MRAEEASGRFAKMITDFNVVGLDGNGNWTIIYNRENYV